MPVLLHREVSKPAQCVNRKLVMHCSQLDSSDVTLMPKRIKMILMVASEGVQNHALRFTDTKLAFLTVTLTMIRGQLGSELSPNADP